jgi:sulfate adenylyltransferase
MNRQEEREQMSPHRLQAPHGGTLLLNQAGEAESAELLAESTGLPRLAVGSRHLADLEMLATGAYSPLSGFLRRADYLSVVNDMHLSTGLPWTIPVTLAVQAQQAARVREGARVVLVDANDIPQAILTVEEIYPYDKHHEASQVYRTQEEQHPGVRVLYQQGDLLLGGPVRVIALQEQSFARYRYTPTQTRELFAARGWTRVVGFQTRNPVHRAHEYIQKCALESVDGLYLHPLVGDTKEDDVPAGVRMRCYEVLLEHYYPADRVLLGVLPAAMRYAGPREAVFHALMRKNYGCSHFIVGRDHAGVGNYYGTYDAQTIFAAFDAAQLGITPMFFEHAFFCRICGSMASARTCPHEADQHITLSGTRVRQLLQAGQTPPPEFSRPEVAAVLIEAMRNA